MLYLLGRSDMKRITWSVIDFQISSSETRTQYSN